MTALFDPGDRGATLSDDGRYRYDLWRRWDDGPLMGWVMLNPSIGDAETDDHTIRKCVGFARLAGAAGISIRNLFAYRTPKPNELRAADRAGVDVVGPANSSWLARMADDPFTYRPVVAAWGSGPPGRWPLMAARVDVALAVFGRRLQRLDARHLSVLAPHPARLGFDTKLVPLPEELYAHRRT